MENEYSKIPHPDNSKPLKLAIGTGGSLGGSIDVVILFVGEIREYSGTRTELEDFYVKQDVALRFIEKNGEITNADCCLRYMMPSGFWDFDFKLGPDWQFSIPDTEDVLYIVFFTETRNFCLGCDRQRGF